MTTATLTLTDFLLARIAEDEAGAFEVHREPDCDRFTYYDEGGLPCDCGWPDRIKAECEAKRRIVELHGIRTERDLVNPLDGPAYETEEHYCEICGWVPDVCDTVKVLALPYADHPDFRDEWRA